MKNTLCLHFASESGAENGISAIHAVSPVEFTTKRQEVDVRDILTKPEFMHTKVIIRLTFKDECDCHTFMRTKECRETYDRFSLVGKPVSDPVATAT